MEEVLVQLTRVRYAYLERRGKRPTTIPMGGGVYLALLHELKIPLDAARSAMVLGMQVVVAPSDLIPWTGLAAVGDPLDEAMDAPRAGISISAERVTAEGG